MIHVNLKEGLTGFDWIHEQFPAWRFIFVFFAAIFKTTTTTQKVARHPEEDPSPPNHQSVINNHDETSF